MNKTARIEKILPFIIAFLMPGLTLFNNQSVFAQFEIQDFVPIWITISIYLIILWHVNEWLSKKVTSAYYYIVIPVNLVIGIAFLAAFSLLLPDNVESSPRYIMFSILRIFLASILIITIQQSLSSAKTVERLRAENLSLKSEKYKAELDQLKKQVNPHFLFNSLSTLRSMVRGSHPGSEEFVINLSSLYRHILQSRDNDCVPLEEEMKLLNAYIYLMKVRYEEALQVKIEIDPESMSYCLPIFAMQLLVENCVKHNIASVKKPLHIHIFQRDKITITVSNNYQPKEEAEKSDSVGLSNLESRYRLLGVENGLVIEKDDNNYSATLKLT
jgi:sensor histidine kinase YesM